MTQQRSDATGPVPSSSARARRTLPDPPTIESEAPTLPQLDALDPALLLLCLVHLTGDSGLLKTNAAGFHALGPAARGADPATTRTARRAHDVDAEVARLVRDEVRRHLRAGAKVELELPDLALFQEMASFCVGEDVDAEFLAILREQSGFVSSLPSLEPTRRPPADFKVIVIGAGLIGINAAVKLSEAGFNYTVFESRDEVGGTWSINKYPGAAVDTPSHYYSYSFELNPSWSHYYPLGPEYLDYLKHVVDKYELGERIALRTTVLSCDWDEDKSRWIVTTACDGVITQSEANAVICALGEFNRLSSPVIEGREAFEGLVVHAGSWPEGLDMGDKRIAVLGSGCTAVQLVAALADEARAITVIQRQPHWITPEPQVSQVVSEDVRWALERIPFYHQWFRLRTYWYASDKGYLVPRIDPEWAKTHVSASPANDVVAQLCLRYIDEQFHDRPDLVAKLTPDYPPYAKRNVKDPGYFKALKRPHVQLLTGTIERFEGDGVVVTGGEKVDCDVVVMATGFTIDFLSTVDIRGRGGVKLSDVWGAVPRAHLGVMVPQFPNLFITSGPNACPQHGGGNNFMGESQVHYFIECLRLLVERDAPFLEVTQAATDEYNARVDEELDKTVWQHGGTAHGYYRNAAGRAALSCPWRMVDYWTMLRQPALDALIVGGEGDQVLGLNDG